MNNQSINPFASSSPPSSSSSSFKTSSLNALLFSRSLALLSLAGREFLPRKKPTERAIGGSVGSVRIRGLWKGFEEAEREREEGEGDGGGIFQGEENGKRVSEGRDLLGLH